MTIESAIDLFIHATCALCALAGLVCGFCFWTWLFCKIGR